MELSCRRAEKGHYSGRFGDHLEESRVRREKEHDHANSNNKMKLLMATLGMAMSSMVAHAQGPLTQLDNQAYALCAGAISFVFDQVAYANCQILFGTSISLTLSYLPFR
jgi:hypothetical protein